MSQRAPTTEFFFAIVAFLALVLAGCGGAHTPSVPAPPSTPFAGLTAADVQNVVQNAAMSVDAPLVIAVTDRGGNILAVFQKTGAPATAVGNFDVTVPATEL